jgi:hypothetical protein
VRPLYTRRNEEHLRASIQTNLIEEEKQWGKKEKERRSLGRGLLFRSERVLPQIQGNNARALNINVFVDSNEGVRFLKETVLQGDADKLDLG